MTAPLDRIGLPPDLPERVFAARGWLSHVEVAVRRRLLGVASYISFASGAEIVSAGQEGGGPYGLVQGRVGCWGSSRFSASTLGNVAVPGDWFGQGPVQLGVVRSIGFRALEPSVLLYLPAPKLREMVAAEPELQRQLGKLSETSAQLLVGLLVDALMPRAERRIAAVLVKLRFRWDRLRWRNSLAFRAPRSTAS
jgi:CRP/FNR family transcriptional regulator, cyclic AMP receptor protein